MTTQPNTAVATFANGCFWCTEAIFEELDGVISAVSGYTGGQTSNPTYKEVSDGETGHAECLQITYDTTKITFDELLEVFWQTHDPTTLNRQGADVGTQYRGVNGICPGPEFTAASDDLSAVEPRFRCGAHSAGRGERGGGFGLRSVWFAD